MGRVSAVLAAAGAGALATYFLDSEQGRRRRAVLRDKTYGRVSHLGEASRVVAVDLRNRLKGSFGAARRRVLSREVPDEVLAERVRAALGRVVSHPGSISVEAIEGTITLRGPILEREAPRAIRAARWVPGVREVHDELEHHEQAGDVPGLQGGRQRVWRADIAQEHWAPATRLSVGTIGTAFVLHGLRNRSALCLLAGTAMLARAGTNIEMRRLLGWGGRRSIEFTKTLHIAAPVERVFEFWQNFENFPQFMRNVRRVHRNADGSWHWEVAGPLGARVQWDAVVTRLEPTRLVAWSTVAGAPVAHAGRVRFQPEGGGTRLQVEMGYNPAGGALGHALASLFGADPKSEMDDDLMRLKAYFETGKPARDAAAP